MRIALWLRAGWFVSLGFALGGCGTESRVDTPVVQGTSQALTAADCPAGYHLIQGTNAAETLTGTAGNDCIIGLGGNDTISGGGGNDYIAGGNGDDIINGEAGNDQLFGEAGGDTINGGDGNDAIDGGTVADTINCGAGDDTVLGGAGDDIINGDAGRDVLNGGDAVDTIHGGTGDDLIHGDGGNDELYGDDDDDVIDGDANADSLFGGNGDDVLYGDLANDDLHGDAGDDALIGGAGANTSDGGAGTDACTGTSCEKPVLTLSGCTQNAQCSAAQHCIADFGLCIGCVSNQDNDALCDSKDGCPTDASKTVPGACGCGTSDADGDGDGTANCNDGCPSDASKVAPGVCGCGVSDADGDGDGTANCNDGCPSDASKVAPGVCGCGVSDADGDGDGTKNCNDGCPSDASKVAPGVCGCGTSDADSDNDGTANCNDGCVSDANKTAPGICGCGTSDADSDNDGTANCNDGCPSDASKVAPGVCGCGVNDADSDGDGTKNCNDGCPSDATKVAPGVCGCGTSDADSDNDGTANCNDGCVSDANKTAPGICGCGTSDADSDNDGTPNCNDGCPSDASKVAAGVCGCGVSDADSDNDGTPNCNDGCPSDASKVAAGVCGCGTSDADSDNDGTANCNDTCPGHDDADDSDGDGIPTGCDPEVTCNASSHGSAVRQGDVPIYDAQDIAALAGIQCITGGLGIYTTSLSELTGLEGLTAIAGELSIASSTLTSLDGLSGLEHVGYLSIGWNAELASLAGLSQLTTIDDGAFVESNPQLAACWVWEIERQTDTEINGYGNVGTSACGELPPDFECVPGAVGPGVFDASASLSYDTNSGDDQMGIFDVRNLGGVTCITGDVSVRPFSFAGADASLAHLVAIGGHLSVEGTAQHNLSMFQNLREVGRGVAVVSNLGLTSLSGLGSLNEAGAHAEPGDVLLSVQSNPCLPQQEIDDLALRLSVSCGEGAGPEEECVSNDDQPYCESIGCYDPIGYDSDDDGITDLCDLCQFVPDSDADNLCDDNDPCPFDDGNDEDHDGVCGDVDQCWRGDDHQDTDADGMPDGCDECPNDAGNDPDGDLICAAQDVCSAGDDRLDADNDGFCDAMDQCPGIDDADDADENSFPDCVLFAQANAVGPTNISAMATADINGDGHVDLVVGTSAGELQQWLGNGAGGFTLLQSQTLSAHGTVRLIVADANGDGHADVVVGPWPWEDFTARILTGDGNGHMTPWRSGLSAGNFIRFGDITGDGAPDLVYGDNSGLYAWLGASNPANAYQQHVTISQNVAPLYNGLYSLTDFELGNLDGDAALEIVVLESAGYNIYYVDYTGSGFAVTPFTTPNSYGYINRGLAIADFDGDGANDLALRRNEKMALYLRRPVTNVDPSLTLQAGAVTFVRFDDFPLTDYTDVWTVSSADVTGSPQPELLFTTESQLWVATAEEQGAGNWKWRIAQHVSLGGHYQATSGVVAGADVNSDNLPDLIYAKGAWSIVSGAYANLNAVYVQLQGVVDPCPPGADPLDADCDGVLDADDLCPGTNDDMDANQDGDPDHCRIFTRGPNTPGWADHLAVGDVDSDGKADVLASTYDGEYHQRLLIGDGLGGFSPGIDLATTDWPEPTALHDLDGDGHLDAVVGMSTSGGRVLYGDGTGAFPAFEAFSDQPAQIVVADVTGDGTPDVVMHMAVGGATGETLVWVSATRPERGFVDRLDVHSSDPTAPWGWLVMDADDLDGDGRAEIIVSNDGAIGVYRATTGGFEFEALPVPGDMSIQHFAVGHHNGDSRADLALLMLNRENGEKVLGVYDSIAVGAASALPDDIASPHFLFKHVATRAIDGVTVTFADVTGNADGELVIGGDGVHILEAQGGALHMLQTVAIMGDLNPNEGLRARDLEQDGDTDLFFAAGAGYGPVLGSLINQSP